MIHQRNGPPAEDTPFRFWQQFVLWKTCAYGFLGHRHDRELAHVPSCTLFFHRQGSGAWYLMASKLQAKIALRPMIEDVFAATRVA